jgi:hypothetical protein
MISVNALSDINVSILQPKEKPSLLKETISKFVFNYYVQYIGPSLSDRYQEGATYNRFNGGTDTNGERLDATGSTQVFQSFKLGYKLPKNLILSYGLTYQDNLNEDVSYRFNGGGQGVRPYGRSFNNHRVSLWIPGVYSNNSASLSINTFVERPTTEGSINSDMRYGLGIQPTLTIYSKVPGLFHGINASVQRDYYKENETSAVHPDWCKQPGFTCNGVDKIPGAKRTTLFATVGGYLQYMVADKTTLKSSIEFDWSQAGDDVKSTERFGNNLDDVGSLSVAYRIMRQVAVEAGVNFALEDASVDKTSIFGSLDITL